MIKANKKMNEISQIIETAAIKYPCINRIGLFGSYARGDYDETSDVDVLYDYDSSTDDSTNQILDFVGDLLEGISPLKADFVNFKRLLEIEDDFKHAALNDVVWVYLAKQNKEVAKFGGLL